MAKTGPKPYSAFQEQIDAINKLNIGDYYTWLGNGKINRSRLWNFIKAGKIGVNVISVLYSPSNLLILRVEPDYVKPRPKLLELLKEKDVVFIEADLTTNRLKNRIFNWQKTGKLGPRSFLEIKPGLFACYRRKFKLGKIRLSD